MATNIVTDEAKKAKAKNYASMMATDGWSDLVKYADAERDLSMRRMDVKSAADLSLGEVCEERGIRKGLHKLIQHAEFCRDGV